MDIIYLEIWTAVPLHFVLFQTCLTMYCSVGHCKLISFLYIEVMTDVVVLDLLVNTNSMCFDITTYKKRLIVHKLDLFPVYTFSTIFLLLLFEYMLKYNLYSQLLLDYMSCDT